MHSVYILSKLFAVLVQSIIKCSYVPCSQLLWVDVSKGTCSHGQQTPFFHQL